MAAKKSKKVVKKVTQVNQIRALENADIEAKIIELKNAKEEEMLKLEIKILENQLKKYEDELKSEEINGLQDEIKELEEELEDLKEAYIFGKNGKIIWYGTEKALEDSKK